MRDASVLLTQKAGWDHPCRLLGLQAADSPVEVSRSLPFRHALQAAADSESSVAQCPFRGHVRDLGFFA